MRLLHYLVMIVGLGLGGCSDPDQTMQVLETLERGKATGSLVLSTDGRMSFSQGVHLGLGPTKSILSFSGQVNFTEPLLRPSPPTTPEDTGDSE